jgi:hypothetical protein
MPSSLVQVPRHQTWAAASSARLVVPINKSAVWMATMAGWC